MDKANTESIAAPHPTAPKTQAQVVPEGELPAKKHKSMLDDSEGEAIEEEPHHDEHSHDEPIEELQPQPPKKRLKVKTSPEDAHPSYQNKMLTKRKAIDYTKIKADTERSKKSRRMKFDDFATRQSHISRAADKAYDQSLGSGAWSRIHHTHKRAMINDIIFCIECGKSSIKKVEGLALHCPGVPSMSTDEPS